MFKGTGVEFKGVLPTKGTELPDFQLTNSDMQDVSLKDFQGNTLILNIFPSIDTRVCSASVREFNKRCASLGEDVRVLCISKDLPFAHGRFCSSEGIDRVVNLSAFRDLEFGTRYGLEMANTSMQGLLGRAVIVADAQGVVRYTELVPDIGQEPNYEAALAAI